MVLLSGGEGLLCDLTGFFLSSLEDFELVLDYFLLLIEESDLFVQNGEHLVIISHFLVAVCLPGRQLAHSLDGLIALFGIIVVFCGGLSFDEAACH